MRPRAAGDRGGEVREVAAVVVAQQIARRDTVAAHAYISAFQLIWLATRTGSARPALRAQATTVCSMRATARPESPSAARARQAHASASATLGSSDACWRLTRSRSRDQQRRQAAARAARPEPAGRAVSASTSTRARASWRVGPS